MHLPLSRTRLGILAGAVGAAGALTFVAAAASESQPVASTRSAQSSDEAPGDISGPCDEAEHANDPECAGVVPANPTDPTSPGTTPTTPTTPTTAPAAPAPAAPSGGTHTVQTVGGDVTYSSNGSSVSLVSAVPARGWRVEVEQSSGREVELDFRTGSRRVQVNLEIEDGHVRERVRIRDDATGTDVRVEDGMVVRDDSDDSGHGDDNSGHGSDDSGSDSSGSGHSGDDDSSGHGGHGSDDSGSDSSGSGHSGGSDDD